MIFGQKVNKVEKFEGLPKIMRDQMAELFSLIQIIT